MKFEKISAVQIDVIKFSIRFGQRKLYNLKFKNILNRILGAHRTYDKNENYVQTLNTFQKDFLVYNLTV